MNKFRKEKYMDARISKKSIAAIIKALKIAIGSSVAIYIAISLNANFATSAGIITLLTIVTTTLETVRLSILRLVTFVCSIALSWALFEHLSSEWLAYGIFLLIMVGFCEELGLRETISVNAVIGTHFLTTHDFSMPSIINEFLLLVIGVSIALLINLFTNSDNLESKLNHNIKYTEEKLKLLMDELASYLHNEKMERNVWEDAVSLKNNIEHFVAQSHEFHGNIMSRNSEYHIFYFEMRDKQCCTIHNLHYEISKIRSMPRQAKIIADFITKIGNHISESNNPSTLIETLETICREMKHEELPKTHEEFESRARLYHILMDLEEFLIYKKRFIDDTKTLKRDMQNNKNKFQSRLEIED